jgi:hypothetical protein
MLAGGGAVTGASPSPASRRAGLSISVLEPFLKSHKPSSAWPWLAALGGVAFALAANAGTSTYSYDALGRLRRVDVVGAQASMRQSYQYDVAGNRVGTKRSAVSGPTGIIPVGNVASIVGGNVTLHVSVGGELAGGMISFYVNGSLIGVAPVINGVAEIVFQGMQPGDYSVHAVYDSDGHYDSATSDFIMKVRNLAWLPAVLELLLD